MSDNNFELTPEGFWVIVRNPKSPQSNMPTKIYTNFNHATKEMKRLTIKERDSFYLMKSTIKCSPSGEVRWDFLE